MIFTSVFGVLAFSAPLVAAIGKARVVNNCDFEATLWSVDSQVDGPHTLTANGGSYEEDFHRDDVTGGIALKVTTDPDGLYNGSPQLTYAYTLDSRIWYDLSTVFGVAFPGSKLVEKSDDEGCPSIVWEDGNPPSGSQVKDCTPDKDVTLTLCAE